jgi:hypothetical protein
MPDFEGPVPLPSLAVAFRGVFAHNNRRRIERRADPILVPRSDSPDLGERAMTTTLALIDPNLRWYLIFTMLTVALVVGTVMVHRVWRDVKGEAEDLTTDPEDLLVPLAEAFAAGQMSEEEFQRIRDSAVRGIPDPQPAAPSNRPKVIPPGPATEHDPALGPIETNPRDLPPAD